VPTEENGPPAVLTDAECRRLLTTAALGRLGFSDGALPAIVPVPFVLHEGDVLVPATVGSQMVAAVRGAVVAFQVDRYDPASETGWSVTVVGPSRVVRDPDEIRALYGGLPDRWTRPGRCLVRVQVRLVHGWLVPSRPVEPSREGAGELQGSAPP
jgi:hypothetical protein